MDVLDHRNPGLLRATVLLLLWGSLAGCGHAHATQQPTVSGPADRPSVGPAIVSPLVRAPGAPVILSSAAGVVVAGGQRTVGDVARPVEAVRRWDRIARNWEDLPDLPADYSALFGVEADRTLVLVAQRCPAGADALEAAAESDCGRQQLLLLRRGSATWRVRDIEADGRRGLLVGSMGKVNEHQIGLVPESTFAIGAVTYDLEADAWAWVEPPGGRSDLPVPSVACVMEGGIIWRSVPGYRPVSIEHGEHMERLWSLEGERWAERRGFPPPDVGTIITDLCTEGHDVLLARGRTLDLSYADGHLSLVRAPHLEVEVRPQSSVAWGGRSLYLLSSSHGLVGVPVPAEIADPGTIFRGLQSGMAVDLAVRVGGDDSIQIVSVQVR